MFENRSNRAMWFGGWQTLVHQPTMIELSRFLWDGPRTIAVVIRVIDLLTSKVMDITAWSGLELVEPATGGRRNEVWRGRLAGASVAVRRSRRPAESLAWELDLLEHLGNAGFRVPVTVPAEDGRRTVDGVVVQTWLAGRPPSSSAEWVRVADVLQRLHASTADHRQRPGCMTVRELGASGRSVDADLAAIPPEEAEQMLAVFEDHDDVPTAVVHGDPGPSNIRIDAEGTVGLIDWDESRVDLTWHDLANLGVQILGDDDHGRAQRLSHAWEAANGWTTEPEYARRRYRLLNGG